jgi:hypothetical protein
MDRCANKIGQASQGTLVQNIELRRYKIVTFRRYFSGKEHGTMTKPINIPLYAPPWVSSELVAKTLRLWQPLSNEEFTDDDAVQLLILFAQMYKMDGPLLPKPNSTCFIRMTGFDEYFEKTVRKRLEERGLTPLQEGAVYYAITLESNPRTGKRWKLKEIAEHFGKSYGHVRNHWALAVPYKADEVDETGNVVKKGRGLNAEQRAAFESGESTFTELLGQALHAASQGPVSLREMWKMFDDTDEDNVERRKAIAQCMGLTLKQAMEESQNRSGVKTNRE